MVDARDIDTDVPRPRVLHFGSDFWTMVYFNKRARLVAWLMFAFNVAFPIGLGLGFIAGQSTQQSENSRLSELDRQTLARVQEIRRQVLSQRPNRLGAIDE